MSCEDNIFSTERSSPHRAEIRANKLMQTPKSLRGQMVGWFARSACSIVQPKHFQNRSNELLKARKTTHDQWLAKRSPRGDLCVSRGSTPTIVPG
jgi:hypothetical protein